MQYLRQKEELEDLMTQISFKSGNYVFYSLLLSEVNKRFSTEVSTACLAKHLDFKIFSILFNPDFWDKLNKNQKVFLILHEAMHYIYYHWAFIEYYNWDKQIANIAMDLTINQEIILNFSNSNNQGINVELPEGALEISHFLELKLLPNKDSNYYYTELIKAKENKDKTKGKKDSKNGKKDNLNGTSGSKELDRILDENIDWHDKWEEMTKELSTLEKEVLKKEIDSNIQRVSEEALKQNGTLPSNISKTLENLKLKPPTISWKQLFRLFVASSISTDITTNRKRPNKRFNDNPGLKFKQKIKGVFLADSSGSISDKELQECNEELLLMYKAGANIDYASWDSECDTPVKYKGNLKLKRTKSGGTDLNTALLEINKNYKKNNWNFAIITSDMQIPKIRIKTKIPTLILITSKGTTKYESDFKYKTIKMKI